MTDDTSDADRRLREVLSFLSHDAREGHSSALALIELHRVRGEPAATSEMAVRLERNARRALARIDDYVALARAHDQPLVLEPLPVSDLLVDAVAEAWQAAGDHGIRLKAGDAPEEALVLADRSLLTGALQRLVAQALQRGQRGTDIVCAVVEDAPGGRWEIRIDEQGERPEAAAASHDAAVLDGSARAWALIELSVARLGGHTRMEEGTHRVHWRVTLPRA